MAGNEFPGADDQRAALKAAVTRLYGVFSRYKLMGPVTGALCCIQGDARLIAKPLNLLTKSNLEHYTSRAVTTHGTLDDFRHFLPRILELTAFEGDFDFTDIEIVLGKLAYSDWQRWRTTEKKALRDFMHALWADTLGRFPASLDPGTCLCAIGNAEDDLGPYLDVWQAAGFPATRHLANFITDELEPLLQSSKLQNAFWMDRPEQMSQVIDWLRGPAISQKLQEAFFGCQDQEFACELSNAVQTVDWLCKRDADRQTNR